MVGAEVTSYLLDVQPGLYKVLASTVGEDTTRYIHGPMGMQSQQSPQGAWVFPVTDGLGSVRGVVSDGLSPLESRQYEPYGEPFGATGAEQTPFGFTGEWTDDNDLLYLRARYLDPAMGRFFQMDPLEGNNQLPLSINAYTYAMANPARFIDPSGQNATSGDPSFGSGILEALLAMLMALGVYSSASTLTLGGGEAAMVGGTALGAGSLEALADVVLGAFAGLSLLPLLLSVLGGIIVGILAFFLVSLLIDPGFRHNFNIAASAGHSFYAESVQTYVATNIGPWFVREPQAPRWDPESFLGFLVGMFMLIVTMFWVGEQEKKNHPVVNVMIIGHGGNVEGEIQPILTAYRIYYGEQGFHIYAIDSEEAATRTLKESALYKADNDKISAQTLQAGNIQKDWLGDIDVIYTFFPNEPKGIDFPSQLAIAASSYLKPAGGVYTAVLEPRRFTRIVDTMTNNGFTTIQTGRNVKLSSIGGIQNPKGGPIVVGVASKYFGSDFEFDYAWFSR